MDNDDDHHHQQQQQQQEEKEQEQQQETMAITEEALEEAEQEQEEQAEEEEVQAKEDGEESAAEMDMASQGSLEDAPQDDEEERAEASQEEEEEEEEEEAESRRGSLAMSTSHEAGASAVSEDEIEEEDVEEVVDPQVLADAAILAKKLVPAKSAWMLYTTEARQALKTEQPSLKITEQVKLMSERWKALSDEARQPYLDRAAADKERYHADKAVMADAQARQAAREAKLLKKNGGGGKMVARGARELSDEMLFPLVRIRRIMKLDPEVKTVSKDAAVLVAKATELFLDMLGEEASKASGQRRTLKGEDVAAGMRRKGSMAFLRPDFPLDASAAKKKASAGPQMNAVAKLAAADKRKAAAARERSTQDGGGAEGEASDVEDTAAAGKRAAGTKRGRKGKAVPTPVPVGQGIKNFFHKKTTQEASSPSSN